ncbi:MAG: alpha/beta hydrolase [Desulfobacterales bacterium]|nr:alpha/beta hydrolase [Desulfobacterales bacterium]
MNPFAYRTAGYAIKALSDLSKAKIENIPKGAVIFAINHFTRIETLFIPYVIHRLTGMTIWNLASEHLFEGGLAGILTKLGAVSTKNPHRDTLIVKSLLTGEAAWIIFPEGRMVKSKKIYDRDAGKGWQFVIDSPEGKHSPHTGTATLALRTEFYRQRIQRMLEANPQEANRMMALYQIDQADPLLKIETYIVPVNLTYYPIRARENTLSRLAELFIGDMSDRIMEEIITEGTMLLSGVDVDMCFGTPIRIATYLKSGVIRKDINSTKPMEFDDPIDSREMLRKTSRKIMERYMSDIYRMTTVNHDHLLATLIKYLPPEIEESDLKRRVYLAALLNLKKIPIRRHESLGQNQVCLLTDDRYDKFENFISLAVEKKVIRRKDHGFVKAFDFTSSPKFHRARIDNPVVVIANEIAPLTELQEELKNLATQPSIRIKYRFREHLVRKAAFDFERDYALFSKEGISKPRQVGRPFMIKGKTRDLGILLSHGYMAAPLEVRALAEYLGSKGYWVYGLRLPGHGTSPEDLAARSYMEWVESVEEGFCILENTCRRVVAGGFSTGAGLVLDLCTRVQGLAGVFAISPPFKLQDFSSRFVPAVTLWNKLMKKINVESARKEFVENKPENPHINYFRNPVSGIKELDRLMDQLGDKLSTIQIPTLIIQSLGDPVVNPDGAMKIFKLLGAADKELLMVNTDRHGVINGEGSERIFKAVGDFIEKFSVKKS